MLWWLKMVYCMAPPERLDLLILISWKARNLLPLQKELAVIVIFPWSQLGEYSIYSTTRKVICLVPIIRILSILSLISGCFCSSKTWWFVATSIWRKFQVVFNRSRHGFFPCFPHEKTVCLIGRIRGYEAVHFIRWYEFDLIFKRSLNLWKDHKSRSQKDSCSWTPRWPDV